MQIREMRSALDEGNVRKGFAELPHTFPDWAIRRMFEQRNGLPLSPLPRGIEVRSLSSIMATSRAQRPKAIVHTVADEADRNLARLRIAVARLQ
jgi:hypothetical protein